MNKLLSRSRIIKQARTWIGTKYHHQGRLKKSVNCSGGVDCIGLVIGVADELNICDASGSPLSKHDKTNYSMHPEGEKLASSMGAHLSPVEPAKMKAGDFSPFETQFSAEANKPCYMKTTGAPSLVRGSLTLKILRIYPSSVVTEWHSDSRP